MFFRFQKSLLVRFIVVLFLLGGVLGARLHGQALTAPPGSILPGEQVEGYSIFTFTPVADAYVNIGSPASNYGSSTTLRADASPNLHSFLRFDVQGLSATVTKATLRLYANSSSSLGVVARRVVDNFWSETTINFNNAPDTTNNLRSSGSFGANAWVDLDVTAHITGNGTYTLGLLSLSRTAVSFASREAGAHAPQLVIETHDGPVPTSTPTLTPTSTPTSTPTATSTMVPFPTPIVDGNTFTFVPIADTYVHVGTASTTSGVGDLRVDGSPVLNSYLRFGIQGLSGTVTRATLRLHVYNSSPLGYIVHRVDDNHWNEAKLHYLDAPAIGSALGSSGAYGANTWVEVDVTSYITRNGTYSLALTTTSYTAIRLVGRELPNSPQLIIEMAP